jgi:hypothetical protein
VTTAARLVLAALLVVWCALLMLIMAACGGGTAPQSALAPPVATPAPPVAQTPPSAPPAASAAYPSQAASAPVDARSWVEIWREPWDEPLRLGGWVRHSALDCAGGAADPDRPPESAFSTGAAWSVFGGVIGTLQTRDGALHIDSPQQAGGYALLSDRTWPTDRPLAVQATVTLQPDPGAWLGLALIADESDYRELALYEAGGQIAAGVWHPCLIEWGVATVASGPRTLRLEYTPGEAVCWRHYIDGQMVSSERCSVPGAPLASPARAGLYVVNLRAEAQRIPGLVRATVGSVTVEVAR